MPATKTTTRNSSRRAAQDSFYLTTGQRWPAGPQLVSGAGNWDDGPTRVTQAQVKTAQTAANQAINDATKMVKAAQQAVEVAEQRRAVAQRLAAQRSASMRKAKRGKLNKRK